MTRPMASAFAFGFKAGQAGLSGASRCSVAARRQSHPLRCCRCWVLNTAGIFSPPHRFAKREKDPIDCRPKITQFVSQLPDPVSPVSPFYSIRHSPEFASSQSLPTSASRIDAIAGQIATISSNLQSSAVEASSVAPELHKNCHPLSSGAQGFLRRAN